MIKRTFFFLFLGLAGCNDTAPEARPVDGDQILRKVMLSIDHDHPGRGLADYPSDEPADVPKSYALILLGAIEEARAGHLKEVNALGVKAGNWLIENADANADGIMGWGVPIAWDAYGDGSVNPENTEYAISTAIAVDALLGWAQYVDDKKKAEILALVEQALKPYLPVEMRTPAGLLPYSLLVNDRKYDTFNSAVYLAGQMQRFAEITPNGELKEALQSAADATMLALVRNKKIAEGSGSWYWNYSIQEDNPNDLPHAGYIIEGILTYMDSQGRLSASFDRQKVFQHLMDFFGKDGKVRGWPAFRPEITTAARLYDLSIASQLMCRFKDPAAGNYFLGEVERYEGPEGGYLKYPRGTAGNRQVAEYESYLYRALKACGFSENAQ
ncbi:hypothetical protein [Pseudomonas sichuanensis]|uniref:hypothetical protein n=1 Tax=Pseudomonas sichuanensis TaxID=2213015 RepID=UPI000DA697D1|nr:hypothetical protein [Pseudomonas sichuanensis]